MAFLEVKDAEKYYGEKGAITRALDRVSFSLRQGKICAILGASGSGKSTLLNIIGGLEEADGGSIDVDGERVSAMDADELALYRRNSLGFIFQFYNLVPDLSVKENIRVCEYLSKKPLDVDELIETLGLTEHKNKLPSQLSGGQQQRCAIGRALVKNPKLLLCDEPTGALDYSASKEILRLLERVNREYSTTILIVTHNEAISQMAHFVLEMRDGKIISEHENLRPLSAAELEW